jgi:hypothetical protein
MSLRLKRTVLFFCVFYLGLGGCLGNLAVAKDLWTIFITGVHNDNDVYALKRRVWGHVNNPNESGLKGIGIYDHGKLLDVTGNGGSDGFYEAWILAGVPYTITPKKDGFIFLPQWIEIPADGDEHRASFIGYPTPGTPTLISPKDTTNSSTPTYEWVASSNATRFNLLVEDSTGADKIDKVYTESEAGCASGSANCSVTPSTSLANGSWRWSVQACTSDLNVCGPWSNTMGFIVSAAALPYIAYYSIPADPNLTVLAYVQDKNLVPYPPIEVLGEGLTKSIAVENACRKIENINSSCIGEHNGFKIMIPKGAMQQGSVWNCCK